MKTKATALLLVALMLLATLSGCQSKAAGVILTADGDDVPVGVYIYYQITAAYEALYLVDNPYGEIWDQMIDDVTAEQWIQNKALDDVKRMVAIEKLFDAMGLTLSEEDVMALDNAVASEWSSSGDLYERNGIARTSIHRVAESLYKQRTLFTGIYGAEGSEPIDESDLVEHFREDYARLAYMIFYPEDDEAVNSEDGDDADASEAAPDGDTDLAEAPDTEPDSDTEADLEPDSDSEAPAGDSAARTASERARYYYDRALAGEDFAALIDEYEAEEDEDYDPANHDHDHFFYLYRENAGQYPADFIEALFATQFGDVGYYEDDYYIFVYLREDPMEDESTFAELDYTLRYSLRESVFEARIADQQADIAMTESAAAIKKFTPSNLQFS